MPVWHNRHRLGNPAHRGDVLSALGGSIFGSSGFGNFLTHLLLLMVLSSAAASTQTTILPTARTTLSMAVYKALPAKFANIHRKYLVPTVSTVSMGAASVVLYMIMNHISAGTVLMLIYGAVAPPFFRGEILNAGTETLVPEDLGAPVGLFGVDEEAEPAVT
jgi:amino acid transporter